jgi:hypothetical protein
MQLWIEAGGQVKNVKGGEEVPVYETFSKKMKVKERTGQADVYQYDDLPKKFRIQVCHIWNATIGRYYREDGRSTNRVWDTLHDVTAREAGEFHLNVHNLDGVTKADICVSYFVNTDTQSALDMLDISFQVIYGLRRNTLTASLYYVESTPKEAITELNARFKESGLGYEFVAGELIRIDSTFIHAEAVKPALALLHGTGFNGANEEFFEAHKHYRQGDYKDAIATAGKAFESAMKAICAARSWSPPPNKGKLENASAGTLINVLMTNNLIPEGMRNHLNGLEQTLSSGLPPLRNDVAHGQGASPVPVEEYVASYALHLAATNIVFLVKAHNAMS